jgi:hypothetical protein
MNETRTTKMFLIMALALVFATVGCVGADAPENVDGEGAALKGGIPAHRGDGGKGRSKDRDADVDEDVDEGSDENRDADVDEDADEGIEESADENEGRPRDGGPRGPKAMKPPKNPR